MNEKELIARLAELTGLLSPLGAMPDTALDRARRNLAEALLNGQAEALEDLEIRGGSAPFVDELSPETLDRLRRIAQDAIPAQRDPRLRVFRRCCGVLTPHISRSTPAWARGQMVAATFGPFEDSDGSLVWFDVRLVTPGVVLVEAQSGRILLRLPGETLSPQSPPQLQSLAVPHGSIWLAASLFDPSSPAGAVAGLRIRGGELQFSHPGTVHNNVILVNPGIVVTLEADLEHSRRPQRTRSGGDARNASVELPGRVTFVILAGPAGRLVGRFDGSIEAYGASVRLTSRDGAASPRYDARLKHVWFPLEADAASFAINETVSELFLPEGEARIAEAGWVIPVAMPAGGNPMSLGEASGAGALALRLNEGLRAAMPRAGFDRPARLDAAALLVDHTSIAVIADGSAPGFRRRLTLWQDGGNGGGRSRLTLLSRKPLASVFAATMADGGAEVIGIAPLTCRAELDRPLTAAAERVPFTSARAELTLQNLPSGVRISLDAVADPAVDPITGAPAAVQPLSFALSNAFARTGPADSFHLNGVLSGEVVDRGALELGFLLRFLLPSLPDPYAATINRTPPRELADFALLPPALIGMTARVQWEQASDPEVVFRLSTAQPGLPDVFPAIVPHPFHAPGPGEPNFLQDVEQIFPNATGQIREVFRLLDVSSRADLFGVGYSHLASPEFGGRPLALRGLQMVAALQNVSAFVLPAFQWEAVYDIPNPKALPGFPPELRSLTDGGPTRFALASARLTPVAPVPVLDAMLAEYNVQNGPRLAVRMTLPFGIVGAADMRRGTPFIPALDWPHFDGVRPMFTAEGYEGGRQVSLTPAFQIVQVVGGPDPGLPGMATQTNNATAGFNVLKIAGLPPAKSIDFTFNNTFGNTTRMVPVRRVDFSGYGGSTFSDWRREVTAGSGVTQVRFDAITGRTAREVVQVKAKVYPYGAVFTRDITMLRTGSGGVFRRDSGWQAATHAEYKFHPSSGIVVHPGVVPRLVNIRNIRDTVNAYDRVYSPTRTVSLVQVLFDADCVVEGVTLGANQDRLVPARDIVGYVQIRPMVDEPGLPELSAAELDDLFASTGPLGGPIDCELNVAQSGLHQRLSRFEVDRAPTLSSSPQFAVAARGTVELSDAGQWTFAFQGPSETEPRSLPPDRPIPLIRTNPVGGAVPPYRFAEPRELHQTSPKSSYSLVQSTGPQRLLVPRPEIRPNDATIYAGAPMLFADMYTLAGTLALFPRPDLCHPLPNGSVLRMTARRKLRLDIPPQLGLSTGEFKVGPVERTVSKGAALRVRSRFRNDATIKLIVDSDAAPNWSCVYGPVAIVGDFADFEDLFQVSGKLTSSAIQKPELQQPFLTFGGALAPIQDIISFLTSFGLSFPFFVAVTNAEYAFKSGAKLVFPTFALTVLDKLLKHGAGWKVELELVAGFGKKVKDSPGDAIEGFPNNLESWSLFVEFEAKVMTQVINKLPGYVGGAAKFELSGTTEGKSELAYHLGMAGAVEGDLEPVAKLKGSRTYTFVIKHEIGEKVVKPGISSEWEVEGQLLPLKIPGGDPDFTRGLVEVKFSVELLIIVEKPAAFPAVEEMDFKGEATVAIDVTLGFVFSKTFEIEFKVSDKIAAAVFVASTVL